MELDSLIEIGISENENILLLGNFSKSQGTDEKNRSKSHLHSLEPFLDCLHLN